LILRLRFSDLSFRGCALRRALEDCAFFDADAVRDHVAREQAFAPDIQPVSHSTLPFTLPMMTTSLAVNVCRDVSVAADGDAIFGEANSAFDASVNEKRFRTRHFTLDDERASDVGLIHG